MITYAGFSHHIPTMKTLGGVNTYEKLNEDIESNDEKAVDCQGLDDVIIDFSKVKIEPLFEEQVDFDTFSKSDFRAVKVLDCIAVPKSNKLLQLHSATPNGN